ncbi:hypothetical protein QE152_g8971 [Popillia japonica]|uniref:Uncharacterized protein n=1 Tax=Popillia japonica TaxID=7064 RepID=A0AAW1M1J9_POPJA
MEGRVSYTEDAAEVKKLVDEGWQKNAFNQYVSDMISVHRTLPDPRDECKQTPSKEEQSRNWITDRVSELIGEDQLVGIQRCRLSISGTLYLMWVSISCCLPDVGLHFLLFIRLDFTSSAAERLVDPLFSLTLVGTSRLTLRNTHRVLVTFIPGGPLVRV